MGAYQGPGSGFPGKGVDSSTVGRQEEKEEEDGLLGSRRASAGRTRTPGFPAGSRGPAEGGRALEGGGAALSAEPAARSGCRVSRQVASVGGGGMAEAQGHPSCPGPGRGARRRLTPRRRAEPSAQPSPEVPAPGCPAAAILTWAARKSRRSPPPLPPERRAEPPSEAGGTGAGRTGARSPKRSSRRRRRRALVSIPVSARAGVLLGGPRGSGERRRDRRGRTGQDAWVPGRGRLASFTPSGSRILPREGCTFPPPVLLHGAEAQQVEFALNFIPILGVAPPVGFMPAAWLLFSLPDPSSKRPLPASQTTPVW